MLLVKLKASMFMNEGNMNSGVHLLQRCLIKYYIKCIVITLNNGFAPVSEIKLNSKSQSEGVQIVRKPPYLFVLFPIYSLFLLR